MIKFPFHLNKTNNDLKYKLLTTSRTSIYCIYTWTTNKLRHNKFWRLNRGFLRRHFRPKKQGYWSKIGMYLKPTILMDERWHILRTYCVSWKIYKSDFSLLQIQILEHQVIAKLWNLICRLPRFSNGVANGARTKGLH